MLRFVIQPTIYHVEGWAEVLVWIECEHHGLEATRELACRHRRPCGEGGLADLKRCAWLNPPRAVLRWWGAREFGRAHGACPCAVAFWTLEGPNVLEVPGYGATRYDLALGGSNLSVRGEAARLGGGGGPREWSWWDS